MDKLKIKNGFLICPNCNQRTNQKILPETAAQELPVWCNRCKHEITVNISKACAELLSGPR